MNILIVFGAKPESEQFGIANTITGAAQREECWELSLELERRGSRIKLCLRNTLEKVSMRILFMRQVRDMERQEKR